MAERETGKSNIDWEVWRSAVNPSIKQVFDALCADGYSDPDWRGWVLSHAKPEQVDRIHEAMKGRTESEAAQALGILC